MSPGLQLTRNIAAALHAMGFSGVTGHDSSDTTTTPRITAAFDNSTRLDGLPGLYDVTGRIELEMSPDDQTQSERGDAQAALWEAVADIPAFSARIGTNINLYIWKIEGESISEDDPLVTYSIPFSARISLNPTL